MARKIGRDSTDGRFVSQAEARRRPNATTVETVGSAFVSPAMEEAGAKVLRGYLEGDEAEVCRAIYRAMWKARP